MFAKKVIRCGALVPIPHHRSAGVIERTCSLLHTVKDYVHRRKASVNYTIRGRQLESDLCGKVPSDCPKTAENRRRCPLLSRALANCSLHYCLSVHNTYVPRPQTDYVERLPTQFAQTGQHGQSLLVALILGTTIRGIRNTVLLSMYCIRR